MLEQSDRFAKFGINAAFVGELQADISVKQRVRSGDIQVLFITPEAAFDSNWREVISSKSFSEKISTVVVDEAHCISHWGNDFRPNYRRLGDLRSFLRSDVRYVALTGTATDEIKLNICESLHITNPVTIYVPMERSNIYYEVRRLKADDLSPFQFFIDALNHQKQNAPKTIVYCRNVKQVAVLFNHFNYMLGSNQYLNGWASLENRFIAMFHRSTAEVNKNFVLQEFKKRDSIIRIVFATTSFEMGLDFEDVEVVVNFGVPRSLESFAQQCGRGGRRSAQAFSLVLYHGGSGLNSTTNEMREFSLSTKKCRRSIINRHFKIKLDKEDVSYESVNPIPTGCRCCDVCKCTCECLECFLAPWAKEKITESGDIEMEDVSESLHKWSPEKLSLLEKSLQEYYIEVFQLDRGFTDVISEFWSIITDQILLSCSVVNTIDDLLTETHITDLALAEDLFMLIEEIKTSN
eukprot:gene7200-12870_t